MPLACGCTMLNFKVPEAATLDTRASPTGVPYLEYKEDRSGLFLLYNCFMDEIIYNNLGANQNWGSVTNILLVAVFAILGLFGIIGLVQWIKRKSLKKVDPELLWMLPSLVLMAVIYVIFEKFIVIHTRPIMIGGVAESSFPSTHVMIAATILLMVMRALPRYISSRARRIVIDVCLTSVIVVMAAGRVLAGMHWMSDVLGGLVFGAVLMAVYVIILKLTKEKHE